VGTGAVSRATYDQARFTLEADKGKLESLRQQAAVQLAKLAGHPNIPRGSGRLMTPSSRHLLPAW
jgi:membrane fusion protein (multidrug efflux system)